MHWFEGSKIYRIFHVLFAYRQECNRVHGSHFPLRKVWEGVNTLGLVFWPGIYATNISGLEQCYFCYIYHLCMAWENIEIWAEPHHKPSRTKWSNRRFEQETQGRRLRHMEYQPWPTHSSSPKSTRYSAECTWGVCLVGRLLRRVCSSFFDTPINNWLATGQNPGSMVSSKIVGI